MLLLFANLFDVVSGNHVHQILSRSKRRSASSKSIIAAYYRCMKIQKLAQIKALTLKPGKELKLQCLIW